MADLNSAVNVATYERDTDVVATPPEHVLTDAERRRQSDERLGRNLSNRVRIEMEDGEEEQQDEDMEGDPRDEIEALLESERLPEENARRRAAQNDAAVREALRRLGVEIRGARSGGSRFNGIGGFNLK